MSAIRSIMNQESDLVETLVMLLIRAIARGPLPVTAVEQIVSPTAASAKMRRAFNLCDGTRTQAQVAAAAKIDQGQLSRAITRWEANGVLFRLGSGRLARLFH